MILTGREIRKEMAKTGDDRLVVWPFFDDAIQIDDGAASLDLRIGTRFTVARRRRVTSLSSYQGYEHASEVVDEHYVRVGETFILHPQHFVLGTTLEWLRLPPGLAGDLTSKSTMARLGLNIATAVGVHPGFAGTLTLELANLANIPIEIHIGQPVCQIFFHGVQGASTGAEIDRSRFLGTKRPQLGQLTPSPIDKFLGVGRKRSEEE